MQLDWEPRERLLEIMANHPQIDKNGKLNYLLAGGFSIEAFLNTSGYTRLHHDLDFVLLRGLQAREFWQASRSWGDVEVITPDRLWGNLRIDLDLLTADRKLAFVKIDSRVQSVEIVHPLITLVQKLVDYDGWPPRPQDEADAEQIVEYMLLHRANDSSWRRVLGQALTGVPAYASTTTFLRLRRLQMRKSQALALPAEKLWI